MTTTCMPFCNANWKACGPLAAAGPATNARAATAAAIATLEPIKPAALGVGIFLVDRRGIGRLLRSGLRRGLAGVLLRIHALGFGVSVDVEALVLRILPEQNLPGEIVVGGFHRAA